MKHAVSWAVIIAGAGFGAESPSTPVLLENEHLLAAFSPLDGSLVRLRNKRRQLDLISVVPEKRRPWALMLAPFNLVTDFEAVRVLPDTDTPRQRVSIEWRTPYDITIKAEARLSPGADSLELRCAAENSGSHTIIAFRYPALQGIGPLRRDGSGDRLLHSTAIVSGPSASPTSRSRAATPSARTAETGSCRRRRRSRRSGSRGC